MGLMNMRRNAVNVRHIQMGLVLRPYVSGNVQRYVLTILMLNQAISTELLIHMWLSSSN